MSLLDASPARTFVWVTGGMWLIGAAISVLHFRSLLYTLDDNYVTKLSGRLWWHRRAVPLDQITSLDVRQGPVERLFGMGQVWIFTPSASDAGPEEKLIGVKDADSVREAILKQSRQAKQPPRQDAHDSNLRSEDLRALLETIRDSLEALQKSVPPANTESASDGDRPGATNA
jgi:membrane protein YdbS with pleckstrin-like domain